LPQQRPSAAKSREVLDRAKRPAQNVLGHFVRWLDQDRFVVRDTDTYQNQTVETPNRAAVLRLEGVKEGDLVRVKGDAAEIVQRASERDLGRGRER